MKEKMFWSIIGIILASWGVNFLYFQSKQLDQPLFFKHYYETEFYNDQESLTFYYLANKKDQDRIQSIRINGIDFFPEGASFGFNETPPPFVEEFAHQYLRAVTIPFQKQLIPMKGGRWSFDSMEVQFENKQPITVDIGKVSFSSIPMKKPILEPQVSGSNSSHRSDTAFVATEPLTIEQITLPFPELTEDIEMKINLDQEKLKDLGVNLEGKEPPGWFDDNMQANWNDTTGNTVDVDLLPIRLEYRDWFHLMTYSNPNRNSYYQFSFEIQGKTNEGEPFKTKAYINDQPELTEKSIEAFIESQGGGEN